MELKKAEEIRKLLNDYESINEIYQRLKDIISSESPDTFLIGINSDNYYIPKRCIEELLSSFHSMKQDVFKQITYLK